jgi:PleD family two-component response regulator
MTTRKVIIISCQESNADELCKQLEENYDVTVANGMLDAMDSLNSCNPDLIIFHSLEEGDDMFLEALPKADEDEYIPIVVIEDTAPTAIGVDAALTVKAPYSAKDIKNRIMALLKHT